MTQDIRFRVLIDDAGAPQAGARVEDALNRIGRAADVSGKQTAAAMRQLPAQLTDVATQLAGGQNPLLVLLQQGGQVKDSFGGLGNTFRALGSLITPARVAIGGLAAVAGGMALAIYQGDQETRKLQKDLALTGYAAGVSAAQIDLLSQRLGTLPGATVGKARDALAELATTGAFVGASLESAGRATLALQRLNGQSAESISKDLAGMRQGVTAWASAHNQAYHFMTADQLSYVEQLEVQGRSQEAARLVLDELTRTLESRTAPTLGYIDRLLESTASGWSRFWSEAKGLGKEEAVDERIKALQVRLRDAANWGLKGDAKAAVEAELQSLQRQQARVGEYLSNRQLALEEDRQRELANGRAFQDAQLGYAAAQQAKLLAQDISGAEARRRAADKDYRERLIGAQQYTAAIENLERTRAQAQVRAAEQALAIEQARKVEAKPGQATGQAELEKQRAVLQAEQRLIEARSRRADIEARINANEFRVAPDAAVDSPQALLRRQELNNAYAETDKWLQEQRLHVMALDHETALLGITETRLEQQRRLVNRRDLAGRYIGDQAREAAARRAELEDQFDRKVQQLDDLRRSGTIDQRVYDDRLDTLKLYHESALKDEEQFQAQRRALEADAGNGMRKAMADYTEQAANKAQQAQQAWTKAFSGIEDALVNLVTTGKLGFSDLARSILADMTRVQVRQWMSQGMNGGFQAAASAGWNWLSSAALSTFGGLFHAGGVVGAGGMGRSVPALAFAGAPRYHTGGIAGDEVPAILQRGEEVLTRTDPRHRANGGAAGGMTINVGAGQVVNIGQGVSRAEVAAGMSQAYRTALAETQRMLRNKGVL